MVNFRRNFVTVQYSQQFKHFSCCVKCTYTVYCKTDKLPNVAIKLPVAEHITPTLLQTVAWPGLVPSYHIQSKVNSAMDPRLLSGQELACYFFINL